MGGLPSSAYLCHISGLATTLRVALLEGGEIALPVRKFFAPKRDNLTSPYPQSISSISGAETGEFAPRITYG